MEQEVLPREVQHTGYKTDSSVEEELDPTTLAMCPDLLRGRLQALQAKHKAVSGTGWIEGGKSAMARLQGPSIPCAASIIRKRAADTEQDFG